MADEFKVIETQEQLNAIIVERLKDEQKRMEKKYSGYLSPEEVDSRIAELGKSLDDANEKAKVDAESIASLEAKVKGYETASVKSRIAHEVGIPYELANRLNGETEEEIRKDAEALKPHVTKRQTAPLRDPEAGSTGRSTRDQFASYVEEIMT